MRPFYFQIRGLNSNFESCAKMGAPAANSGFELKARFERNQGAPAANSKFEFKLDLSANEGAPPPIRDSTQSSICARTRARRSPIRDSNSSSILRAKTGLAAANFEVSNSK